MGKLILGIETFPWSIIYRAAIGYVVIPLAEVVCGENPTFTQIFIVFLAVLVGLRVVPGVLRRILPVESDVKAAWAMRRLQSRRHDSYQWQKLLGHGVGLGAYAFLHPRTTGNPLVLAGICVAAGAAGLACWLRVSRVLPSQKASSASV